MKRAARFLAAAVAALLPGSWQTVTIASPSAPVPAHQQQRDAAALPSASAIQSLRVSRKTGPLGLPFYARAGLPPWIDRDGRLLRQVVR